MCFFLDGHLEYPKPGLKPYAVATVVCLEVFLGAGIYLKYS
jgi:hypothetical protein